MDEVSLCTLFLMEAAKKVDQAFLVTAQDTKHTVRDSQQDIRRMVDFLLEKEVTSEISSRSSSDLFSDPTLKGMGKLTGTWLQAFLSRTADNDDLGVEAEERDFDIDLDFELTDNGVPDNICQMYQVHEDQCVYACFRIGAIKS